MSTDFEFWIAGPPVSQQTRRRARYHLWVDEVRTEVRRFWPATALPILDPIAVSITYYYDETALDVDNIPKAVLDAMKGIVYLDDAQITDLVCRKRDLSRGLRVLNPSPVLTQALAGGTEVLWVLVQRTPDEDVAKS